LSARGAAAADRACTPADIARFERIIGGAPGPIKPGETRTDPRFQMSLRYLGTRIVAGVCDVKIRPVN
jgi:hypothetical protein